MLARILPLKTERNSRQVPALSGHEQSIDENKEPIQTGLGVNFR